jgi:1,4-alpha-glucan branching enzyme
MVLRKIIYVLILCLSATLYGVDASGRPGVGAIPYDTGTTFRVWAPNAASINVAGSFNSWSSTSNPLASEAGGWWSVDIAGANLYDPYRYVINGTIWKTDPRAGDVASSVGDGIIVDNSYGWTPFTPPAWNEMIIYEMHIGSFNDTPGGSPGTWQSAISKLDHIQSLGINAVEIMPIAEFPGDFSMGYNPVNLFAPESAYGSPDQMRDFIDQCHQRGIAVLIDVVYNHLGPTDLGESIWQFDGYSTYTDTGGIYFYEDDNRYTPWGDTRPNYLTGEVRSFIRDNVMYWLNDFNMDGVRMDGTAYMRERGIGGPDIPEGWSLMQWINNDIDAAHSQKICIAEDMRDNNWITKTTGEGGAGFDSQWDPGFHHKVVPALEAQSDSDRNMWDINDAIIHLFNGWDTQRVIYTENHDEAGAASGKARVPSRIWWDDPDSYYSKKRSTLGAGLVFTCPGIPLLFMGQEFLEDGSWHDADPLDWSKNTTFAGIKQLYTDLVALRRNLSGHTQGLLAKNVNVFHVNNTDKVIAFHRWHNGGPGDDVIVVANFSDQGFTDYNIGMPRGGRWRVRFNSDWNGYDGEFGNWNSYDTYADSPPKDSLGYNANVGIGPYSIVILSQGTSPDIDGDGKINLEDFSVLAGQWQTGCDDWNSCQGADFNMSGLVDMTDLYILVSRWLEGFQ